jgi:hypothetical protein
MEKKQYLSQIAYQLASENLEELKKYMDLQIAANGPLTANQLYSIYDYVSAIKRQWRNETDEFNDHLGIYPK